jgi:hypothetical protein
LQWNGSGRNSNDTGEINMAKYVAKPVVVDAFKIKYVRQYADPQGLGAMFDLTIGDDGPDTVNRMVTATPAMTSRMVPQVGDYWVIQPDGYIYLNPKDVFENKYDPK